MKCDNNKDSNQIMSKAGNTRSELCGTRTHVEVILSYPTLAFV